MQLFAGQRLSHYEVLDRVGAGSMGEVWRARDTRLERDVALKVLPDELARDDERLQRFEREAKTLASLAHPNVATVYGFDREADTCFMAMELVPGEDLAERLSRGALSLTETLDVCGQIAEGLEAAHDAGIVHRDLKPANVRITPDGRVKVLDFGLAKPLLAGGANPAVAALSTGEGRVLGTPAYMAPEQARGRRVDRRADVWALGCLIYECLSGRRVFSGDSGVDVISAVLDREPDWSALPPSTPARMHELLERCLVKDPRNRMRDVGDVRLELARAVRTAAPRTLAEPRSSRARWFGGVTAASGAVGIAAIVFALQEPSDPALQRPRNPLAGATFSKVTDGPGTEFSAAISRDGKFLAFVSDRGGLSDVWLVQVGVGTLHNLTDGRKTDWALKIRDVWFDPDGRHVYLSQDADNWLSRVPIMGGELRRQFERKFGNVDWSPDGNRLAYHTSDPGDPLFVGDADGQRSKRILMLDEGLHQHFPTWAVDGDWIFLVRGHPGTQEMDLWRVRPDGSDPEQLTSGQRDVAFPTPLDAQTVLYVAHDASGAGPWLWVLDLPSRRSRRAGVGIEQYTSIAASSDGRRLVATVANPRSRLWSVPLLAERPAGEEDAGPFPALEGVGAAAPRFGPGGSVYFASSGALRVVRDGVESEVLPATQAAALVPPAISSSGALAVVSRKSGRALLHVVSPEGVVGSPLAEHVEILGSPDWSPDGTRIVAGGRDAEGRGLFLYFLDGRPPKRIAAGIALNPVWSPVEDLIVYAGPSVQALHRILAVRPSDGTSVELPETDVLRVGQRTRFLPDGSGLVYMEGMRVGQDFWLLDLASGEKRLLARLEDRGEMRTFDIDPDGQRIVFDRTQPDSDVVLIERAGTAD